MKRKTMSLVMAAAMIVGIGMGTAAAGTEVYAEEFQGEKDWKVEFNGEGMESSFQSSELAEEIYRILPGDTIHLQVNVGNTSDGDTDWYMTNEVLQSLEDTQSVAEGGAYGYELIYEAPDGEETVLFSSETVGGEAGVTDREGLHQASSSLEDYFYLGRLTSGQSGRVLLTVQLDGETQGNDYQDTLARLRMNFAVEEVEPNTVVEKGEDTIINEVVKKVVTTAPKTGDPTQLLGLCAAALVSGIVLLVLAVVSMKKRRDDRKGDLKS